MSTVAGTALYAREYQRLRQRGLPTKGLADRLRNGDTLIMPSAPLRRDVEIAIARGHDVDWITANYPVDVVTVAAILEGMV